MYDIMRTHKSAGIESIIPVSRRGCALTIWLTTFLVWAASRVSNGSECDFFITEAPTTKELSFTDGASFDVTSDMVWFTIESATILASFPWILPVLEVSFDGFFIEDDMGEGTSFCFEHILFTCFTDCAHS